MLRPAALSALVAALLCACPLPIEVRCEGAQCDGDGGGGGDGGDGGGGTSCATDFGCPAGQRCEGSACVAGARLGDSCRDSFDCPGTSFCNLTFKRCDSYCSTDFGCPAGYSCSPDGFCIEGCAGVPATLGLTCESSPDCPRCGYCVTAGSLKRCHQRCLLDRDCDGGVGSCESQGSYRVCKL